MGFMMAYVDALQFVNVLRSQKAKYHAKVLSDDAIGVTMTRIFDVGPLLELNIWLSIPELAWTALGLAVLYSMPPIVFDPIRIAFDVDIPHIEIEMPKTVLERIVSLPDDEALRAFINWLPREYIIKIEKIMPPTMKLIDIIRLLKRLYPPDVVIRLPETIRVWIPDWRAFLNGIYLIIKNLDLFKIFEWLKDIKDFILKNFKLYIRSLEKCIYGVSEYGRCYYDPTLWQEMIRGTLMKIAWSMKSRVSVVRAFKTMAAVSDTNIEVVKHVYRRIAMVSMAQTDSFILGYSILGVSLLTRRSSGHAEVTIPDFDGGELTVHFDHLAHLQFGFILGVTPLGHGVLLPREDPYVARRVVLQGVHETDGGPPAQDLVDFKARRMMRQAVYTPMALANYQRPDERLSFLRSARADQYAELMALYKRIDAMVDAVLERHGVDAFHKRIYKNAVRELIGHKAKRHEWGYGAWLAMDENTFKQWWVEWWTANGLDKVILEELYETVARWLDSWRRTKYRLGASLRMERLRLAGLA